MSDTSASGDPTLFCITDVGSTTTKAILYRKEPDGWRFYREESPTTVEKPDEDVTIGVVRALETLERTSGQSLLRDGVPSVSYLSTSSAGGGLAMVVTGLVKNVTAESADRVALGAGALVLDVIAMNDGRTPYQKIEDLKTLRPDMVLLAGGFDGDAVSGPVMLAELIVESGLHPKLNPDSRLPVIYAGNVQARDYVGEILTDRYLFHPVANIRPRGDREDLGPAREAIHRLFMDHVMSQAPGYERLKSWVSAPILPTPAAFGQILALVSRESTDRILAIDVGGATTDVFTAENGRVFRTVSANLGMSYSILNVARLAGTDAVRELLDPPMTDAEILNRIGNKYTNPTSLPGSDEDRRIEWACATLAIREAVRAHRRVLEGIEIGRKEEDLQIRGRFLTRGPEARPEPPPESGIDRKRGEPGNASVPGAGSAAAPLRLHGYDLVIGSGGILSHSPREAAAVMLRDALRPGKHVRLAVDSAFMFPHLGALGELHPDLARVLFRELGTVELGEAGDVDRMVLTGPVLDAAGRETSPPSGDSGAGIQPGPIRLRRELALPGRVFVNEGDTVTSETLVARSMREFLRPFFLEVARHLGVSPEELPASLRRKVGDDVEAGDVLAERPRLGVFHKTYCSPVSGRIERIGPGGTVIVREAPELARELTTVRAAETLGVRPQELARHLRCEVGQEIEREQVLAAKGQPGNMKACRSPVRGRVNRIALDYGMIVLEPLLEELDVLAWLPGRVAEVTDRGCVVVGHGLTMTGVWGAGGETTGRLRFDRDRVEPGEVHVCDFADAAVMDRMRKVNAAGVIAAGADLVDVLDPGDDLVVVVLGGFGRWRPDLDRLAPLRKHDGRVALLDGTTQLRVGVRRPLVMLPE